MADNELAGNFMLVGPRGCGKSSTGNMLLSRFRGHPFFNVGDDMSDGTVEIKIVRPMEYQSLTIGDCLGFGYKSISETQEREMGTMALYDNFCSDTIKSKLINQKFKFFFCVKFDAGHYPNPYFKDAAQEFVEVFDNDGVKSMVIIAIQERNPLSLDDFTKKLEDTDGYKFLIEKLADPKRKIPFCLWDNQSIRLPMQLSNLRECVNQIDSFMFTPTHFSLIKARNQFLKERKLRMQEEEASKTTVPEATPNV